MADSPSKEPRTLSAKWKLLAASVLVAGLIALLCGQCESFTKAACMKITASLLLPIDQKTSATQTKSETATTYRTTTLSTITTSATSSNDCGNTSLKKFATSTVANMGKKISDLTIMPVSSTVHLTINSSINKSKALLPMRAKLYQIFGRSASARSANSTSKPRLIPRVTYLKKSRAPRQMILICATTNTAWHSGFALRIQQCL